MHQQRPLFPDKNHQATTPGPKLEPPPAQQLRGIIQRSLDELQATQRTDWIRRTSSLKFKRLKESTR